MLTELTGADTPHIMVLSANLWSASHPCQSPPCLHVTLCANTSTLGLGPVLRLRLCLDPGSEQLAPCDGALHLACD